MASQAAFIWVRLLGADDIARFIHFARAGCITPIWSFFQLGVIFAGFFHPFLTKRIALFLYEHFFQIGVFFVGFFHPFLPKMFVLLLYEHFFKKGVIIWLFLSPQTPDLLPLDDFVQKGVFLAEKKTPFWKKFLYRSSR